MTEADYIKTIRAGFSDDGRVTPTALEIMHKALTQYPDSPALWCLRGNLIQLSDGCEFSLADAKDSYLQAIALNPDYAEAYEELGHFYNAVDENLTKSEEYFRKSIALGGSEESEKGLADVLEQMGKQRN